MASAPILQLNSCIVRPWDNGDVESLAKVANNPMIARWLRNTFPSPYTIQDGKDWISVASTPSQPLDFAISEPNGTVIGGIGLKPRTDIQYRTMEIGYWLGEDYWRRGIASEVVTAFSNWAFETFEHVVRLDAEVFEGNLGSCRVLEKAGFEFEGRQRAAIEKLGNIMDTLTYVKLR
ncbi:hypothetical protein IL306_012554 [Fusarium sp. DS 682]|nr:hypothetical protein IL306_012554 [Fusarium sp. DS 682]